MSGGDEEKGPAPAKGHKPARAGQFPMHEHIGRHLKTMFDEVIEEPIPTKLTELLEELERNQPKK
jgi:Anti-sigma factor NepR